MQLKVRDTLYFHDTNIVSPSELVRMAVMGGEIKLSLDQRVGCYHEGSSQQENKSNVLPACWPFLGQYPRDTLP